jgi:hypothetical protein
MPGPLIFRFLLIESGPLVSVIVPLTVKLTVSPAEAAAIAAHSELGLLSDVSVTVMVLPKAGRTANVESITSPVAEQQSRILRRNREVLGFISVLQYVSVVSASLKGLFPEIDDLKFVRHFARPLPSAAAVSRIYDVT